MNLKIVFVQNKQWWNIASAIIRLYTCSQWDHVGIYIDNNTLSEIKKADVYQRLSNLTHGRANTPLIFDATVTRGVKLRKLDNTKRHQVLALQNCGITAENLVTFIFRYNNTKYDLCGVFSHVCKKIKQRNNAFYCSELISKLFTDYQSLTHDPVKIPVNPTPQQVYTSLISYAGANHV
jgi:hypothetical protein